MKSFIFQYVTAALIVLLTLNSTAGAITPSIGEIKDSRTTGEFFAGLDLELKLVGDDMADVKGIRTSITSAVDETGRDLVDPQKVKTDFEEFNTSSYQKNSVTLSLKNPARKAAVIKELKGELQFFVPKKDPSSTVKVLKLKAQTGKAIPSSVLKTAGIEMTVLSKADHEKQQQKKQEEAKAEALKQGITDMFDGMFGGFMDVGENDLVFMVKDPNKKLVNYEVVDASGKRIDNNGSMSTGEMKIVNYSQPLPDDATLMIYVMTPGSIQTAKLEFASIALP